MCDAVINIKYAKLMFFVKKIMTYKEKKLER